MLRILVSIAMFVVVVLMAQAREAKAPGEVRDFRMKDTIDHDWVIYTIYWPEIDDRNLDGPPLLLTDPEI